MWPTPGATHRVVTDVQSTMRAPVVLGVKRSKEERLDWDGGEVRVADILAASEVGERRSMMMTAGQSHPGASAFFGLLYTFARDPEVTTAGRDTASAPALGVRGRHCGVGENRRPGDLPFGDPPCRVRGTAENDRGDEDGGRCCPGRSAINAAARRRTTGEDRTRRTAGRGRAEQGGTRSFAGSVIRPVIARRRGRAAVAEGAPIAGAEDGTGGALAEGDVRASRGTPPDREPVPHRTVTVPGSRRPGEAGTYT